MPKKYRSIEEALAPDPASEHEEQRALFEWAALSVGEHPELALLFAVPNGGWRAGKTAAILKQEGVKPGVPDVWLPVPRGGKHGLVIEMKCHKRDSRVRPYQKVWLEALAQQGYQTEVAWDWEQAREQLLTYLKGAVPQ